ncbi:MAG: hypothetical protein WC100_00820 [Sterolibacterium sp.]
MEDFNSHVKLTVESESKARIRCRYEITFADAELNWVTSLPLSDGESLGQLQRRVAGKLLRHLLDCFPELDKDSPDAPQG